MMVESFEMTANVEKVWRDNNDQEEGQAAMSYCSCIPGIEA